MRAILIDWLMELCAQFEFKRSTFHLSINILDQYLTKTSDLPTDKFQLIGVTSLIISAKMEVICYFIIYLGNTNAFIEQF